MSKLDAHQLSGSGDDRGYGSQPPIAELLLEQRDRALLDFQSVDAD